MARNSVVDTTIEPSTTEQELMTAALEVLGRVGYRGATTKDIAAVAGVSEMTLFRRFGSKADLYGAATEWMTAGFRASAQRPSDNLTSDLGAIVEAYVDFVDTWGATINRILVEMGSDNELGTSARAIMAGNAKAVRRVLRHHQKAGRLVEDHPDELARALLGPLLARVSLRAVLSHNLSSRTFDTEQYVDRFLNGWAHTAR